MMKIKSSAHPGGRLTNWRTATAKKFSRGCEGSRHPHQVPQPGDLAKGLGRESGSEGQRDLIYTACRLLEDTDKLLCAPEPRSKEE